MDFTGLRNKYQMLLSYKAQEEKGERILGGNSRVLSYIK